MISYDFRAFSYDLLMISFFASSGLVDPKYVPNQTRGSVNPQYVPKTGSKRVQNTANILGDCLFFVFLNNFWVLEFFNYSQMANFDFQMDCNMFWVIYGTL